MVPSLACDNKLVRLNNLHSQGDDVVSKGTFRDDAVSQGTFSRKKINRVKRVVGNDKGGRGLRQFSMKVCEKVENKGRTTYNEVADELVAEFTDPCSSVTSLDQQQYDEKNIRRRVYDALNVLMAMDIMSKDKKEIQWKGLPSSSISDAEELKAELVALRRRIEKKSVYMQELEEQFVDLKNLVHRNAQLYGSGNAPTGGVILPFILVQTRPHATVEVEISEDMQLVHFDFNSTPFELHDDAQVLKAMRAHDIQRNEAPPTPSSNRVENSMIPSLYQHHHSPPNSRPSNIGEWPNSPPVPGILKPRVTHGQ